MAWQGWLVSCAASGNYTVSLHTGEATPAIVSGLVEGVTYFFAATAANDTGESDDSDEVSALIRVADTGAPVGSITSPTDGLKITHTTLVTIQADAHDDIGVVAVTMRVNGQLICTDQTVPYQCSWAVPAPKNRHYQLQATATDAAGNVGSSPVVEVLAQ